MKLYTLPPSPNTMKVVAVAHQLNLNVEMIPVDMQSGFNKSAEYLALNPNGLMPTLVDDGGFSLWESNAIMMYLTSKAPGQTLLPADAQANADVMRWIFWNSGHLGPAVRPYMFERLVKPMMRQEQPDEAKVAEAEPQFMAHAKVLDDHLAQQAYMVGDQLTLADFATAANLAYVQVARLPIESFKNIQTWLAKMVALPAWQKAVPQMASR